MYSIGYSMGHPRGTPGVLKGTQGYFKGTPGYQRCTRLGTQWGTRRAPARYSRGTPAVLVRYSDYSSGTHGRTEAHRWSGRGRPRGAHPRLAQRSTAHETEWRLERNCVCARVLCCVCVRARVRVDVWRCTLSPRIRQGRKGQGLQWRNWCSRCRQEPTAAAAQPHWSKSSRAGGQSAE
jgi:hypothetical protein